MTRVLVGLVFIAGIGGCKKDDETGTTPSPTSETGTPGTAIGLCEGWDLTARPWQDGASATPALKALAGDLAIETRGGDFVLTEQWTGCESYLFVRSDPPNWSGEPMWDRDHEEFLRKLPLNTHVFFVSDSFDSKAELDGLETAMNKAIRKLGPDKKAWWTDSDHLHYVKKSRTELDGWVGDYLSTPGWGFAIDRFQKIRDIGSLADQDRYDNSIGWFQGNLEALANEPIYYNFESDRQDVLDAQQDLNIVELWDAVRIESGWGGNDGYIDVDIPAGSVASADSLTVEMDMTCDGVGEYGTCPAWDRITALFVCDAPQEATNPYEDTACQPYVAEVPGVCHFDGVADPAQTCSLDTDCAIPTGTPGAVITCEGVVPAIPADTAACPCSDVTDDSPYDAARTCEADGLGYGACACSCDSEVARWITTYHREGRWTADARHALPWFEGGGPYRFRYSSIDPYVIDIDLRFHDQALGARPTTSRPLFTGGSFGPTYNDKYSPVDVLIPANATKVEIAVLVTGHGQEAPGNCAEFCDTEHHFSVNGADNPISFPYLTSQDPEYWCENMVDEGTVPNQYGTWFYSRSNWCPGKQVDPIHLDVTSQVILGQVNTFEYAGGRNGGGPNAPGASIDLSSFLVIHQ